MNATIDQSKYMPSPAWEQFQRPDEAHHAAFEAWIELRTGAVILKFWFPIDGKHASADCGLWRWELRHPAGARILFDEGGDLFAAADHTLAHVLLTHGIGPQTHLTEGE